MYVIYSIYSISRARGEKHVSLFPGVLIHDKERDTYSSGVLRESCFISSPTSFSFPSLFHRSIFSISQSLKLYTAAVKGETEESSRLQASKKN